MVWLPYNQDQQALFADLASVFAACRQAFRDVASESEWRAAPGSDAATDQTAIAARVPSLEVGGEFLITRLCHDYLYAASEQLGAVAALYASHEVLLSPCVIARCAVEHCAHVMWVLGTQDQSVEDRLARVFLEEIKGAEHAKRTASHLMGHESDDYRHRAEKCKALKQHAARCFAAPTADNNGDPLLIGHQLPRPEYIVTEMYSRTSPQATPELSEGIYDFLSNFTHPTLYPTRELFDVVDIDGNRTVRLSFDPDYHLKLTQLTVAPFYTVLAYAIAYHRWSDEPLKRLEARIDRVLPGALVGSLTI